MHRTEEDLKSEIVDGGTCEITCPGCGVEEEVPCYFLNLAVQLFCFECVDNSESIFLLASIMAKMESGSIEQVLRLVGVERDIMLQEETLMNGGEPCDARR